MGYSWIYIKSESDQWTVGFYGPQDRFYRDSDHECREEAAKRCAYLNGEYWADDLRQAMFDIQTLEKRIADLQRTVNEMRSHHSLA